MFKQLRKRLNLKFWFWMSWILISFRIFRNGSNSLLESLEFTLSKLLTIASNSELFLGANFYLKFYLLAKKSICLIGTGLFTRNPYLKCVWNLSNHNCPHNKNFLVKIVGSFIGSGPEIATLMELNVTSTLPKR